MILKNGTGQASVKKEAIGRRYRAGTISRYRTQKGGLQTEPAFLRFHRFFPCVWFQQQTTMNYKFQEKQGFILFQALSKRAVASLAEI